MTARNTFWNKGTRERKTRSLQSSLVYKRGERPPSHFYVRRLIPRLVDVWRHTAVLAAARKFNLVKLYVRQAAPIWDVWGWTKPRRRVSKEGETGPVVGGIRNERILLRWFMTNGIPAYAPCRYIRLVHKCSHHPCTHLCGYNRSKYPHARHAGTRTRRELRRRSVFKKSNKHRESRGN